MTLTLIILLPFAVSYRACVRAIRARNAARVRARLVPLASGCIRADRARSRSTRRSSKFSRAGDFARTRWEIDGCPLVDPNARACVCVNERERERSSDAQRVADPSTALQSQIINLMIEEKRKGKGKGKRKSSKIDTTNKPMHLFGCRRQLRNLSAI